MSAVEHNLSKLRIYRPTAVMRAEGSAPTYSLDRPLKGLTAGLRHDGIWQSWIYILGMWAEKLKADGATALVLQISDHIGDQAAEAKRLLDEWIAKVDCAIVGAGT